MNSDRPDILIAIDLGTTFTGVGWARPQFSQALQTPIQIIQNWPGCSTKNEQKCQTCLVYGPDRQLSTWGFLCDEDDSPEKQRKEFFKIFLDKLTLLEAQRQGISAAPATTQDAQQLVADFLRQVYQHVKYTVELQTGIGSYGGWKDMAIEFIFSVPTTWRSQDIINTFNDTIRVAGFGTEGPRHKATVELTESEAAAVATIKSSTVFFRQGDIFISVDAGGGTTDFAVMQVVEAAVPFPTLAQITQVDGVGIGSTLIDRAFHGLVTQRLCSFPELLQQLPPDCIERLARSEKFKTMKHKFGESAYDFEQYKLTIEGVGFNFDHLKAGIEAGKIVFSREEIQSLFDPHIDQMLVKIREQLNWAHVNTFGQQVNYLILSGGLGSSAYVRERLQLSLSNNPHPCAGNIRILQAPDPQLVVVKGLLLDRMQKLDTGYQSVLVTRRARSSYGVVCKTKYNPAIHSQEEVRKDPLDGQMYAMGQIDWIIKKGDLVDPNNPISSKFSQKIDPNSSVRSWDFIIMTTNTERNYLPTSTKGASAKQLCTVKSDLTGVQEAQLEQRKQPSRACLGLGRSKKFFACNFEVRAIVAPADLRFELWFGGTKFSGNHEPIQVTWDQEGTQVG